MSRALDATCESGAVKIQGKVVTATILSQGTKSSDGLAILEADKVTYVTSNASDIKDLISQLTSLIQLVSDTFSSIGTGMTGVTTAPPPTLPAAITQLAAMKSTLDTMKDNLK